jgi:hypothetical protein
MTLEDGLGLDRNVLRADQFEAGFGERLGDVDEIDALVARRKRCRHPGDDDVRATAGDDLLGRDVRPAVLDIDVETLVTVKTLVLGDELAGELALRHPFELQRHLVGGPRLHRRQRHGAGQHGNDQSFHSFSTL